MLDTLGGRALPFKSPACVCVRVCIMRNEIRAKLDLTVFVLSSNKIVFDDSKSFIFSAPVNFLFEFRIRVKKDFQFNIETRFFLLLVVTVGMCISIGRF